MKKTVFFSKKSSNVFFHILTLCNLTCSHCYINPDQHGHFSLDINTIVLWLELLLRKTKNPNLVFLGGEPTMHAYLPLAIKKARELGYNSVTVDTNGYRVLRVLEHINPEDVDLFSFSLDGPTSQSNDMLRGEGSYERCVSAIREVRKRGFQTSLIFTVSLANFGYLTQMPRFLSLLGVDHFFIQVIGVRGKWAKNKKMRMMLGQVDVMSWLEIIPHVARQIVRRGITVTYPKVFLKPRDTFECAGLVADNYFIFPNGRVYQCPLCEDYPLHSKEIQEGNLIDTPGINETALFNLNIPEGCVMNKIIQPDNIDYNENGQIKYKIACCMLKEKLTP